MNLKFHMQHDRAAGLQKNNIQAARESNIAAVATSALAKFMSTLAFKSIQMTYSLKPLHP